MPSMWSSADRISSDNNVNLAPRSLISSPCGAQGNFGTDGFSNSWSHSTSMMEVKLRPRKQTVRSQLSQCPVVIDWFYAFVLPGFCNLQSVVGGLAPPFQIAVTQGFGCPRGPVHPVILSSCEEMDIVLIMLPTA
ncbi:hypothetical protein M404DRAFT_1003044 [Pisolithus tinctorius Marx 270]|uniref:Uncharacterized protein n=1 Tax=Pisolithus tinctorius Marx 270 TaxID=870435 RepID=A0A0C3P2E3_PISTI|nr:hypothetical protein M404DRAFT_1003044 [Pisolithus tinctorius Marx 270]